MLIVIPSSLNRYPTTAPMIPCSMMLTVYVGTSISADTAITHTAVIRNAIAVCIGGSVNDLRNFVSNHPPPSPTRKRVILPRTKSVVVFSINYHFSIHKIENVSDNLSPETLKSFDIDKKVKSETSDYLSNICINISFNMSFDPVCLRRFGINASFSKQIIESRCFRCLFFSDLFV